MVFKINMRHALLFEKLWLAFLAMQHPMQQTAAVATVFESKESTPSVRPRSSVEGYHKRTKGQERTSECSSETFAKEDKKMLVSSDYFCIS